MPPLFAIFSWPVVAVAIFLRNRLEVALLASLFGAFLLLPEKTRYDLPLLPAIHKHSVSALIALILVWIVAQSRQSTTLPGLVPQNWIVRVFIAAVLLGEFGTVLTNGDFLNYGARQIQGLGLYDAFSFALGSAVALIPFLLGRKVLGKPDGNRLILKALFIAALAYSVLALYEVRMSPQLHKMVYGFFPHDWRQHVRGGGFRPVVFLSHGLVLSAFFSLSLLATLGLARTENSDRRSLYYFAAFWLLITLVLSKSIAALIIAFLMMPVVLFFSVRGQLLVSSFVAATFLSYPILRATGFAPVNFIYETALKINPSRAASFLTRIRNEDRLLEKAFDRIHFGWGGWGRSRVYSDTGIDISLTDGIWVGKLGTNGWIGFVGLFGLLILPIILLFLRQKKYKIGMETSVLAVILAANLLDMIPNSSLNPITWVIAGALVGRLEYGRISEEQSGSEISSQKQREPRYTRDFGGRDVTALTANGPQKSRSRGTTFRFSRKSQRDVDRKHS